MLGWPVAVVQPSRASVTTAVRTPARAAGAASSADREGGREREHGADWPKCHLLRILRTMCQRARSRAEIPLPRSREGGVTLYSDAARELQDRFDTRRLADRLEEKFHREVVIDDDRRALIERLAMFFLATADAEGRPQCSYKGGEPGFVRVLDEQTIAFPDYDGNGMYLSLGNLVENPQVGLLFIDFTCDPPAPAAAQRRRHDRRRRPAAGRVRGRAADRPRARDVGVRQLPALHPPHGARRALAPHAAGEPRAADPGLEAARVGRAACSRRTTPPTRSTSRVASCPTRTSRRTEPPRRSAQRFERGAAARDRPRHVEHVAQRAVELLERQRPELARAARRAPTRRRRSARRRR